MSLSLPFEVHKLQQPWHHLAVSRPPKDTFFPVWKVLTYSIFLIQKPLHASIYPWYAFLNFTNSNVFVFKWMEHQHWIPFYLIFSVSYGGDKPLLHTKFLLTSYLIRNKPVLFYNLCHLWAPTILQWSRHRICQEWKMKTIFSSFRK